MLAGLPRADRGADPVLVWMVSRLGYDRRALVLQTLVAMVVLPLTFAVTDPADNVNWVYGPGRGPQTVVPRWVYLALLMILVPALFYLPAHVVLSYLFGRR